MIEDIQERFKHSNRSLREMVVHQASINQETRRELDDFIDKMDRQYADQRQAFNALLRIEKNKIFEEQEKRQKRRSGKKSASPQRQRRLQQPSRSSRRQPEANVFKTNESRGRGEGGLNKENLEAGLGDLSAEMSEINTKGASKVIYELLDNDPHLEMEMMRQGMRKKVMDNLNLL